MDKANSAPRTFVVGVGMTKFEKPHTKKWDYPDMAREACNNALKDCGLDYKKHIDIAVASYCYGEPTSGQRAVYELGLSGVPIFNTNNNCSSASTALMMARTFIQSKQYKCALVLGKFSHHGFEKMDRGLSSKFTDKIHPVKEHFDHMEKLGAEPGLINPHLNQMTSDVIKLFACAAREHCKRYKTTALQFGKISYKNHCHSVNNPNACLQKKMQLQSIMKSPMICEPITLAMSAPTADGGAAAIVCSEEFMIANGLEENAVEIVAQEMVTDMPSSFGESFLDLAGVSMAKAAAESCYGQAGLQPNDIDVLEVHDCFSCNELFMYEALGLCKEGFGGKLIDDAKWIRSTNGGELCLLNDRWIVNPSGGLESKGHPIGATGLAQCAELNMQLRGLAGQRQVDGARVAMQHNYGIGGAAVVTIYKKYDKPCKTEATSVINSKL
eukprot:gene20126-22098_t